MTVLFFEDDRPCATKPLIATKHYKSSQCGRLGQVYGPSLASPDRFVHKVLLNTTPIYQRLSIKRRSVNFKVPVGHLTKYLVGHVKNQHFIQIDLIDKVILYLCSFSKGWQPLKKVILHF